MSHENFDASLFLSPFEGAFEGDKISQASIGTPFNISHDEAEKEENRK